MKFKALIVCFALLLTACATPLQTNEGRLTYLTVPPGAMLYEGSTALGLAPQTRNYLGVSGAKTVATSLVTAVWPSGAKASTWVNLSLGVSGLSTTISRPQNAPGLDKDLSFAAQIDERKRASDQESANALGMAIAGGLNSWNNRGTAPSTLPPIDLNDTSARQPTRSRSFLKSQSVSGSNRYCMYSDGVVNTVGATGLCPLSND